MCGRGVHAVLCVCVCVRVCCMAASVQQASKRPAGKQAYSTWWGGVCYRCPGNRTLPEQRPGMPAAAAALLPVARIPLP